MEDNIGLYKDNEFWIETFTGKRLSPLHLDEKLIDIVDIAHSLSLLCRFVGHCLTFYSVGEHSILLTEIVADNMGTSSAISTEYFNRTCLAALLDDAAEAYIGDISRPLKHSPQFKFFRELEEQIKGKIVHKFHLSGADWELVKKADNIALATEAKWNMADRGKGWNFTYPALPLEIHRIANEDVEPMFLELFERYGGKY